jgi:hypothetical protein
MRLEHIGGEHKKLRNLSHFSWHVSYEQNKIERCELDREGLKLAVLIWSSKLNSVLKILRQLID